MTTAKSDTTFRLIRDGAGWMLAATCCDWHRPVASSAASIDEAIDRHLRAAPHFYDGPLVPYLGGLAGAAEKDAA